MKQNYDKILPERWNSTAVFEFLAKILLDEIQTFR
jgi:hypothetical protein